VICGPQNRWLVTQIRMADIDQWDDEPTVFQYLGEQLAWDRLAIVLGAGVSSTFGLPGWKDLLRRLFATKSARLGARTDLKREAEHFRNKYYKGDTAAFLSAVQRALYKRVDVRYEVMRRSDTLAAIASLAMGSRRGSASQIITFNWDDMLEIYLEYHGFVTASVTSDRHWAPSADVAVFHPHGFLPFAPKRTPSKDIVFDQWSYTSIMGPKGRLWRETLSSVMRRRTCIFIGLSGNDDNLDLLLQDCMKTHASRLEQSAYWGITFSASASAREVEFWKRRRVHTIVVNDYKKDLPRHLFQIVQSAAALFD
jgi:hypothetical protein